MVDEATVMSNTLIAKVQEIAQEARMAGERRETLTLPPEASVALAEFLVEALDAQALTTTPSPEAWMR